jgi:hypothetical protein
MESGILETAAGNSINGLSYKRLINLISEHIPTTPSHRMGFSETIANRGCVRQRQLQHRRLRGAVLENS